MYGDAEATHTCLSRSCDWEGRFPVEDPVARDRAARRRRPPPDLEPTPMEEQAMIREALESLRRLRQGD